MRNLLKYSVLVVVVLLPIEFAGYAAGKFLQARYLILEPVSLDGYSEYLAIRDDVLGWPSPESFGNEDIDEDGTRRSPEFPYDKSRFSCVSAFGDSFTWGDEVGPEDSYPEVLSKLMGCRVDNFGVRGYGTDQAYLRFKRFAEETADVVILGHFADNILRNVNQLRDLLANTRYGFKPRFIQAEGDGIDLIKLPTLTKNEYANVHSNTRSLLPYEYFLPNRVGFASTLNWPYSLAVGRTLFHHRIISGIKGVPEYVSYYDAGHESGALELSARILAAFEKQVINQGKWPVTVLIPGQRDLESVLATGLPYYEPLELRLAEMGIYGPDVASEMVARLNGAAPCSLYTDCSGTSHFNSRGYAMLARIVYEYIGHERDSSESELNLSNH